MNIKYVPVILALGLSAGCSGQRYSIEVWNQSENRLTEVEVWFGSVQAQFGVLSPGKSAIRSGIQSAPTDTAEIRWNSPAGEAEVAHVDLAKVVPDIYEGGQLTFRFEADGNVIVSFQAADQLGAPF